MPYKESYTPPGATQPHEDVFFLKPGEQAEVKLPNGAANYYVVECGLNPDIYDKVSVNEDELSGTDSVVVAGRKDFKTPMAALNDRPKVEFDNHVSEDAVGTLEITKWLYDQDGADVAANSYTSNKNGLVTIAYLNTGTYALEETAVPKGYIALDEPLAITLDADVEGTPHVTVNGADSKFYTVEEGSDGMTATVVVKNRVPSLQVVKIDAETNEPLSDVHFALYRQVTNASGKR